MPVNAALNNTLGPSKELKLKGRPRGLAKVREKDIAAMETLDAHSIAKHGTDIYQRRFRADFERLHHGKFVAIDIKSSEAYVADSPDTALAQARKASPDGIFYLLRVGSAAAFTSSRLDARAGSRRV